MRTNSQHVQVKEALKSERRGSVEQVWELIERFVVPLRGKFYVSEDNEHEIDWHRRDIYDSTAVTACQYLASSVHGNLTSPSTMWFEINFRDPALNKMADAKEWLERCADIIFKSLNDANFNVEIAESYYDLVSYGTSVLLEEWDEEKQELLFTATPVKQMFFEEDHKKQVYGLYRELNWTAIQMVSKFGEEGVPTKISEMAVTPEGSTIRHKITFSIFPRDVPDNQDTSKPIPADKRPFGYKYILDTTKETLGEEGGYYEMPAYISRWSKSASSKWGYSPATTALADILTLNQIKEATLEAAGKAIDPTNIAEESALIGDLDLDRGGLNIVQDINGIKPYESGTKFDVSNMEIVMLADSINGIFYRDRLELKDSPAMTATEVIARRNDMLNQLNPTLGRLEHDLLNPLIQRTFNILLRANRLPPLPEGVEIGTMDIEYIGPMPMAQKTRTSQAIAQWMLQQAELAEVFPEAIDIVDVDDAVRQVALLSGVPASSIRSEDEVTIIRDKRRQQQEAMVEAEMAQAEGDAMQSQAAGLQAVNNG